MAIESNLKTPGVYINEISLFPPSVAQVETAIPAFIGYTEKDPTGGVPTRIKSLLEYEQLFGTIAPQQGIELTVDDENSSPIKFTFSSGKGPTIKSLLYHSIQMYFINGGGPCYIVSAGLDSSDPTEAGLDAALQKLAAFDEPTLLVIPDATKLDDTEGYGLMNKALDQCAELQDRFTIMDVKMKSDIETAASDFRDVINGDIEKAMYGAAYFPNIKTTLPFNFSDDTQVTVVSKGTLDSIKTTENAYYNKVKAALNTVKIELPPSGAVAGLYASVDASRGVWKAPANVQLTSIIGPSVVVTDIDQRDLNVDPVAGKSINAIRFFTGKGTLVWGARTLAGNDSEWKYVPVRRLFITVEESVKKASARFVFEPNDANTWTKVRAMIENYLTLLWRDGALAGAKPEHAFFVKVGLGQTMSAQDILDGKMIVEIGMAAVRPAEFIILRFSHKMQES